MNEERCYDNETILFIIKELEFIRVSLGKISRIELNSEENLTKFLLLENLFLHQANITNRLSKIWRLLVENYNIEEEESLDNELDHVKKWDLPNHLSNEEIINEIKSLINKSLKY